MYVYYYMENLTTAFQRERKRSIYYDNIHAGAIVTERNRAENAEEAVWEQVFRLGEQVFRLEVVLFVFMTLVFLFIVCRNNGRRARFKS